MRVTRRPNRTGVENKEISAFSGNVRVLRDRDSDESDLFAEWQMRGASRSARFKYAKREPVFGGDGQGTAGTAEDRSRCLVEITGVP